MPVAVPSVVQAKLAAEKAIQDSEKADLLQSLESCADLSAMASAFDIFCSKNRLRGQTLSFGAADEKIGRIAFEPAFARRLLRSLAALGYYYEESAFRAMLNRLFDAGSPFEERELLYVVKELAGSIPLTAVKRSDTVEPELSTIVWLFRNPSRSKTCSRTGLRAERLPFQLGLQARDGDRYIAFNVDVGHVPNARLPTVFDCCWRQIPDFAPGGKTVPTGGLPASDELEEMVALPPLLEQTDGLPAGFVATAA